MDSTIWKGSVLADGGVLLDSTPITLEAAAGDAGHATHRRAAVAGAPLFET